MDTKEQILLLQEENKFLRATIDQLLARIAYLEEELRKAKIQRNSSNSSKPPSSDISSPRRNQSLREVSGKKSGGQPGHKGSTLQMTDNPDEIIELNPCYCSKCGYSLDNAESVLEARRQEYDIPEIQVLVKEYRRNSKKCPRCGHRQESDFPPNISNNVQYGSNIEALISYLSVYQYLPFKRMKELMNHFFSLDISEGTIANILHRMALKARPVYQRIKETVRESRQLGSDETSVKVDGKNYWIWVWQTIASTYITVSKSRGSKAIEAEYREGFKQGILNSDRWAAQLKTEALGHQLCMAHLLRDLKYLEQLEHNDWANRLKEIFKKALKLKVQNPEYSRNDTRVLSLEHGLDLLLKESIPKEIDNRIQAFQKSLIKNRESIFTFLYNKEVPPDNNASERAIRNVKVKQKISGQYKTGHKAFCVLRSVIDTCKKRDVDIMYMLNSIAQLVPAE